MKKLLLFGFDDLPSVAAVASAVAPMGIEAVPVSRREYDRPLEVLAGLAPGGEAAPFAGCPLGGRMIVLCGLEYRLDAGLPALARAGAGPGPIGMIPSLVTGAEPAGESVLETVTPSKLSLDSKRSATCCRLASSVSTLAGLPAPPGKCSPSAS